MGKAEQDQRDVRVREQLNLLTSVPGYWDFRRGAKRDALHGVTQYPAMMVPAMQGKLLDVLCDVLGQGIRVIDPFVGSGTTLVEAMRRGLDFWGQDINPLAVLISLSKIGPFNIPELELAVERVHAAAQSDLRNSLDVDFRGRKKWFQLSVAQDLSRLRRAILGEDDLWVRRMLWVSLTETIRLTSNSRTSTFKLHIRSHDDRASRKVDAIAEFRRLSTDAAHRVRDECGVLADGGFLRGKSYTGTTTIQIGKSGSLLPGNQLFDLLVTSPPYGDGVSTVTYGQYSYLPLQWIDFADITDDADDSCLATTHEIDARALGGSRREALERVKSAVDESPALDHYLEALVEMPPDRRVRVSAFFADLLPVLDRVCERMRHGAYMVWTVGNRRVGGIQQPLNQILIELLGNRGCELVDKLDRSIPNKRMATRNGISQTMRQEQVLIMRLGGK